MSKPQTGQSIAPEAQPVQEWFGTSTAPFLVVPRSLLQSMPVWWQEEFVRNLELLQHAFGDLPDYRVSAVGRRKDPLRDYGRRVPMLGPEPGDQR